MSLRTSTTGRRRRTVLLAGAALTAAAAGLPAGPAAGGAPATAAAGGTAAAAGDVWSWGANSSGQLGRLPVTTDEVGLLPGQVPELADVRAVASSRIYGYAVRQDRRVLTWGGGSSAEYTTPRVVENLSGVSAISASPSSYGAHVLALRTDGTLRAWGDNDFGQIGNGGLRDTGPVMVREPVAEDATATRFTGATAVAAGAYVSLALRQDGTVWAWGSDQDGVIGNGGTAGSAARHTRPTQVPGLTGVTAIAAGPNFALALLADGTVRAWGDNTYGQLGTGDTRDRYAPVPVSALTGVVQIDAGGGHSVARTRTGQVKTWGANGGGQLGDGTTTRRLRPVTARGLTGITDITAGIGQTFAVRADRTVVGWGSNYVRQLGIDGPAVATPRPLPRLGTVTDIDAGYNFSLLLR